MIYTYAEFADIIAYINHNNRWHKKMDRKEGLSTQTGGNPFTSQSSVSYRKSYGSFAAEPFYESTMYD